MWQLFCDGDDSNCKYSIYYRLFMTKFNLSFGFMKTDVCSKCVRFKLSLNPVQKLEKKMDLLQ